jgi:hypothetical protein
MGKITKERLELLAGLPFVRSVEVIGREIRVGLDDGAWTIRTEEPQRPTRPQGIRGAGYRVLFAYLLDEALLGATLRRVADAAGTSTMAVRHMKARLTDEGALLRTPTGLQFADYPRQADRWVVGYSDLVRPKLTTGRVRAPRGGADVLQRVLDRQAGLGKWGWGARNGAALAMHPTAEVRPPFLVHIPDIDQPWVRAFEADPDGDLELVELPSAHALLGGKVADLLLWTELRRAPDSRAEQVATDVTARMDRWA